MLKYVDKKETMEQYLMKFDDTYRKAEMVGCNLEDDLACVLLLSLPDSYNIVVTAIATIADDSSL